MIIGIDISPLQTPHRMRGVGATVINFINNISLEDKKKHQFVLYMYDRTDGSKFSDPLELLDLRGITNSVRFMSNSKGRVMGSGTMERLSAINRRYNKLGVYKTGDQRLGKTDELDVFLQFDQEQSLPRLRRGKTALVLYDIIPYVLEANYLYGYRIARNREHSRKGSVRQAFHRWLYAFKLRNNCKRADVLLAISEKTKKDFVQYMGADEGKVIITPLGVNEPQSEVDEAKDFTHYVSSSWGYMERPFKITKPFLLFVGGADPRRKLDQLVTAFNHLRAEGNDLQLILAGDIMQGPENIPIIRTRESLEASSYQDDIVYMGFVPTSVRETLYKKALAFVYPSVYEGFGLPVLEAMSYGCAVICYPSAAVLEVAGSYPFYAKDSYQIAHRVDDILHKNTSIKREAMKQQAKNYRWTSTSDEIIEALSKKL